MFSTAAGMFGKLVEKKIKTRNFTFSVLATLYNSNRFSKTFVAWLWQKAPIMRFRVYQRRVYIIELFVFLEKLNAKFTIKFEISQRYILTT